MKLAFKIFLIVLVVGGIGSAIYFFVDGMGEKAPEEDLETTKFEEYIHDRANDEIKGKSYSKASDAYDDIMAEISDVANSTIKKDGKEDNSISKREEANSRKLAYYAYSPIFVDYTDKFFQNSTWNETEMNNLKKRANELLNTKLSDEKAKNKPKIQDVIRNVEGYYAAKSLIEQANNCTSVKVAKEMPNKVSAYKKLPFTNNSYLRTGLDNAPAKAKSSCADYIRKQCNAVVNNYYNGRYNTYNAVEKDAKRCSSLADEFEKAFNQTNFFYNELERVYNALESAKRDVNLPMYY